MWTAQHVISIALERIALERSNGSGEGKPTRQKRGKLYKFIWICGVFWSNVILFCSDYHHIKRQIESEMIQAGGVTSSRPFLDLSKPEHLLKLKDRLKKYCQKVAYLNSLINSFWWAFTDYTYGTMQAYKRVVDKPITEVREAGICMRENSFYVDTVRRSVRCSL